MPNSISTLVKRLQAALPRVHFREGDDFYWSPQVQTVFYRPVETLQDACSLLHEAAHAALNHRDFTSDIALLKRENEAWQHAKAVLAPQYSLVIDEETVEDHLDTYRDWLHARSRCPQCAHTGLQTGEYGYECVNCNCSWKVNDARTCQLRRRVIA